MDLLPALFGIACCMTFAFARGGHRTLVALLLCESWAVSNIGWQWNTLAMFQPLDVGVACLGYAVWHDTRTEWSGLFTGLAVSQLVLHALYEILGIEFQIAYLFLLDLTFAAELVVVGWKGMIDCGLSIVAHLRSWLVALVGILAKKGQVDA